MINQSVEKLAMDSKGNIWLAENNGAISKNRLKIDFTIRQVFYKSWWFISLSFIAFAGGIIFYLQRRNKQKRQLLEPELRSNRKLTSEKSRLSRELHDNVGSIATTLVASTYSELENKTEFKNYVKESATDILESLRQSIWVLSEDQISLSQLMARFNVYIYKNTGQIKDYQYTAQLDITYDPILESGDILPLYRILQECFQNSIKYSNANAFSLIVKSTKNDLLIQLKDNGQGTELSQEVSDYGLNNIKKSAAEINMVVGFTSQSGQDFMVQLKSYKI